MEEIINFYSLNPTSNFEKYKIIVGIKNSLSDITSIISEKEIIFHYNDWISGKIFIRKENDVWIGRINNKDVFHLNENFERVDLMEQKDDEEIIVWAKNKLFEINNDKNKPLETYHPDFSKIYFENYKGYQVILKNDIPVIVLNKDGTKVKNYYEILSNYEKEKYNELTKLKDLF